jgi:hypothetical protein
VQIRKPPLASLAAVLLTAGFLAMCPELHAGDGQWSRYATQVPAGRAFSVPSPDRTKTIMIQGMELSVLDGRRPMDGGAGIGILRPAEIGWAPDGKSFFVTSSDGGAAGTWEVSYFQLEYDRVTYTVISDDAVDLFLKDYPCASPLLPNVGLLKYVHGSSQVLLAVEAPLGSSCPDRDSLRGYIVEVPSGAVVSELDRARLLEEWPEALGSRFDRLLRKPRSR